MEFYFPESWCRVRENQGNTSPAELLYYEEKKILVQIFALAKKMEVKK